MEVGIYPISMAFFTAQEGKSSGRGTDDLKHLGKAEFSFIPKAFKVSATQERAKDMFSCPSMKKLVY